MLQKLRPKLKRISLLAFAVIFLGRFAVNSAAQEGRKLIAHPSPIYPDTARKYGVTGVVKAQVVIAPDGRIKETKIVGGHPMLAAAVQEALKSWRYAPANGESTTMLDFNFRSQTDKTPPPQSNSAGGKP